ncbi:MAG: ROK family protein [Alphaproteobacteria bacterium]|nr:ROK family protein [Alphaproteobacteria bacterium]
MRLGIDLGGTKIEGIVLGDDGVEKARKRVATPRGAYDATMRAIADLVAALARETRVAATTPVGIAIPGALSPATGLVKNANSTNLIGHPLDRDLEQVLGRRVRLANDANCFALSEAVDGAGAGHRVVVGVIVGTGTGGGIAVDGKVLTGPNAIAGEWGHNPLPWPDEDERPGPPCYCGKRGCIETFLSGPGLAADFARASGRTSSAQEIAAAAAAGDAAAAAALGRHARRMAKALASVINVLDPDVIVLGGGVSNIASLYEAVPKLWGEYVFSATPEACSARDAHVPRDVSTPLRRNRHGDSSGVRGAAWLWPVGE